MFEHLKLLIAQTPTVLLGIVMFCSAAIFTPDHLLRNIGFLPYTGSIRQWLIIIFVLSSSLLLSHMVFGILPIIKGRFNGKVIVRRGKKRLKELTQDEKEILADYIHNDTMTQTFDCTDGTVLALEYEHLIYRASDLSQGHTDFPYNIQPWVRKYLIKNRRLISQHLYGLGSQEKIVPP